MKFNVDAEAEKIIEHFAKMGCYIYITPNDVNIAVRNFYEGEPTEDGIGWAVRVEYRNVAWINETAYNWTLSDAIRAVKVKFEKAQSEHTKRKAEDQKRLDKLSKKLGVPPRKMKVEQWPEEPETFVHWKYPPPPPPPG